MNVALNPPYYRCNARLLQLHLQVPAYKIHVKRALYLQKRALHFCISTCKLKGFKGQFVNVRNTFRIQLLKEPCVTHSSHKITSFQ